jgi:hypothetical protein
MGDKIRPGDGCKWCEGRLTVAWIEGVNVAVGRGDLQRRYLNKKSVAIRAAAHDDAIGSERGSDARYG